MRWLGWWREKQMKKSVTEYILEVLTWASRLYKERKNV
jgi:hypothetical protein